MEPPAKFLEPGKHDRYQDGIDRANCTKKGAPVKKKQRLGDASSGTGRVIVAVDPPVTRHYGTDSAIVDSLPCINAVEDDEDDGSFHSCVDGSDPDGSENDGDTASDTDQRFSYWSDASDEF
jgi:hypothetical protein